MNFPEQRWPIAFVLSLLASTAFGQSHDRAHPTPLGPGTNKANIQTFEGPHYYYFYGGPGHVDVNFVFKESGFLGNPYRQRLNFDFLKEDGSVESHSHVTSFKDVARIKTGGDLPNRKRFVLRVMTEQPPLIKLGGYYEISVTGAAQFEGPAVGGPVKPQGSESLVKPGGALITPGGPLLTPAGPLIHSGSALVKPGGPLVAAGGPLITHVGPLLFAESPKDVRVTLPADILFDFNQAVIRHDAVSALTQAANLVRDKRHGVVIVQGYTDSVSNDAYNLRLSQQRAQAVADWFVRSNGLAAEGFSTEAFGSRHPVAPNTNATAATIPTAGSKIDEWNS